MKKIINKNNLRNQILKKRNNLTEKEIKEKSKLIKQKLFSLPEFKKSKTIMFFVSFGKEVDTHEMIKESLKIKKVCVSVVKNNKLMISKINNFNELNKKNKYGILEPSKIKKIDKENIDLVIIPGVAFDSAGYRLGYGKGYYDKFLYDFDKEKIGLAFELQIVKQIPNEEHDIVVDKIITEKRVIGCDQELVFKL